MATNEKNKYEGNLGKYNRNENLGDEVDKSLKDKYSRDPELGCYITNQETKKK